MMNLPNRITLSRIILLPVFLAVALINFPGNDFVAGGLFIILAVSDFIDGYIARKYNQVTDFGKFLDPIADKLLVNTVLIIMAVREPGLVPAVVAIVMIARDLLVDALRQVASAKGVILAANIWGKLKTVIQMVALTMALLVDWPFSLLNLPVSITAIVCYVAGVVSLISGIVYFAKNLHVFKDNK